MAERKILPANEGELTAEEKVERGLPVDSSETIIERDAPPEANAQHEPADVAPEELGREDLGPANRYAHLEEGMNIATGDEAPQGQPEPPGGFVNAVWKPYLWPVTTLVAICLIVSIALGVTNQITLPIIEENQARAAEQSRMALLPAADGFEEVEINTDAYEGVSSMYRATNDVGYVITAYAAGYNGQVSVMVAFDMGGVITGLEFLENDETPGLGAKIVTDTSFSEQFVGQSGNIAPSGVDKIAGATVSSNAGVAAINNAVALFEGEVLGSGGAMTEGMVRSLLLPQAGSFTPLDVGNIDGIEAAWAGDDGGYVIVGVGKGIYGDPIYAWVGVGADGAISRVWLDMNLETIGYGREMNDDESFKAQFEGRTDTDGVDGVAGATKSSDGATAGVQNALDALPAVQSAPAGGDPLPAEDSAAGSTNPALTSTEFDQSVRAALLPGAGEITEVPVSAAGVQSAWRGDDGGLIIVGESKGIYGDPILAAVALDENGAVTAIWVYTNLETDGYGKELNQDTAFLSQFDGITGTDGVDAVAGSTKSSQAVIDAVQNALDAYETVKGAA